MFHIHVQRRLGKITQNITFLNSANEVCAGRYFIEFVPKSSDISNIEKLKDNFESIKFLLNELTETVRKQNVLHFCSNSRMKSGRHAYHSFNEENMEEIRR